MLDILTIDGDINGLAVDWITANVYGVSKGGYIFACNSRTAGPLSCTTIVNSPDTLIGIALSPNEGQLSVLKPQICCQKLKRELICDSFEQTNVLDEPGRTHNES